MLEHFITGDISRITGNFESVVLDSIAHIVILASPTPKLIGKSIEFVKLIFGQSANAAENISVWQSMRGRGGIDKIGIQIILIKDEIYL